MKARAVVPWVCFLVVGCTALPELRFDALDAGDADGGVPPGDDGGGGAPDASDAGVGGGGDGGCPGMVPPGATLCCGAVACAGAACNAVLCTECLSRCSAAETCCPKNNNVQCRASGSGGPGGGRLCP